MGKLKDIVLSICSNNEEKEIILYEHVSNYISTLLDSLGVKYKTLHDIDKSIDIEKDNILILSIDQITKDYNNIYKIIGSIILKHSNNIIVINKIKDLDYLDNQMHKLLMSLGFKLGSQTNHDNIFFLFYTYNIDNYKNKPDWLNNENWANPELWEK